MSVTVSPKYQVVIPERVRAELGIKPGMQIDVIAKGGIAYLVPVPTLASLRRRFAGKLDRKGLRDRSER